MDGVSSYFQAFPEEKLEYVDHEMTDALSEKIYNTLYF